MTSQAYTPTAKDNKRLSVYDGDQISAENAFKHFTMGQVSSGVLAVTVKECSDLGLTVASDPLPFPEHVVIDFSKFSRSKSRLIAQELTKRARNRGWQYQNPQPNLH